CASYSSCTAYFSSIRPPAPCTPLPYTTLFRSRTGWKPSTAAATWRRRGRMTSSATAAVKRCGAGLIPASGGGPDAEAGNDPSLADIKPAPQCGGGAGCGAGLNLAGGVGADGQAPADASIGGRP